jgi:hypothetical protein
MPETDALEEAVFQAIQNLSHTDTVYFFGDLCAVNGWNPRVTIGDDETAADLIATRTIPHPESIAFVNFDDGTPSSSYVDDLLQGITADRVTILVHEPPSRELVDRAGAETFSFLGLGDLTAEVSRISVVEYLQKYFAEDSDTFERLGRFVTTVQTQTSEPAGSESDERDDSAAEPDEEGASEGDIDEEPDPEIPVQDLPETYERGTSKTTIEQDQIGSSGSIFGIIYLGHDWVSTREESGVVCAFDVFAKEYDIEIRPDQFTVHVDDGFSFEGQSSRESKMIDALSTQLDPPWVFGGYSEEIPAGGKVKKLVFFPTGASESLSGVRHSTKYTRLLTMGTSQIEDHTGLPRHDQTSLDIEITEARSLPEPVLKELDELQSKEDNEPIQETVLSPDSVGFDVSSWDVEIESWDYYSATNDTWQDESMKDGLFVSLDITPKRNNIFFKSRFLRLKDHDDYEHMANGDSEALYAMDWENLLESPWRWKFEGSVPLPDRGSRVKILQHIHCSEPIDVSEILIAVNDDTTKVRVGDEKWAGLRGLPDHLDAGLREVGMTQS